MDEGQLKIEIYTLTWCPYCRKAKSFFESKGLSYQEYDIDNEDKKQEMQKRSGGQKTVPQIFINDKYIGGYDDLIAMESAGDLNQILNIEEKNYTDKTWDLVIIGAGPAGLSAAVYAARKGLDILILSVAMGGKVIETDSIENYMGKYNTEGPQLMQSFWDHVQEYEVETKLGVKVNNISTESDLKIVETDGQDQFKARSVIIASGTHQRHLGVSGEKELKGHGVHYCAICDGFLYAGEPVAVVGGGNSGLEASIDMAKLGSEVDLIEISDHLMGDKVLQDKVMNNDNINVYTSHEVTEIQGQDQVNGMVIRDTDTGQWKQLEVNAVFIEIGLIPNSGFVNNIMETNKRDEIVINGKNETSIEGIWAAGDVTDIKDKQIIVATAEGAKAALRVNEYLYK